MAFPLLSVLGIVSKPITKFLDNRKEIKSAEHKRDLAIIENQARLAISTEENNHSWEMASLQDKDRWLRRFSFVLFTSPVFVAILSPDHWAHIKLQLDQIPTWMLQIWFYMISGIWGISALKDAVPQIISSIGKRK